MIINTFAPGPDLQSLLHQLMREVGQNIEALPDREDERIHDIRVEMKRFRALFRLAKSIVTSQAFSASDKLARQLKDHFSSSRDDNVLRCILNNLVGEKEALEILEQAALPSTTISEAVNSNESAQKIYSKLMKTLEHLNFNSLKMDDIWTCWTKTYRSSRRLYKRCRKNKKDDLLFHKWRRSVKKLLYQSDALSSAGVVASLLPRAEELSSLLGSFHDLVVLSNRTAHCFRNSPTETLVQTRKKHIRRDALKMGGDLFAEKPAKLWHEACLSV